MELEIEAICFSVTRVGVKVGIGPPNGCCCQIASPRVCGATFEWLSQTLEVLLLIWPSAAGCVLAFQLQKCGRFCCRWRRFVGNKPMSHGSLSEIISLGSRMSSAASTAGVSGCGEQAEAKPGSGFCSEGFRWLPFNLVGMVVWGFEPLVLLEGRSFKPPRA